MHKTYPHILIHPEAAAKPLEGSPCNGCGVCCLVAPCPLGMLLSLRAHGECVALRWHDDIQQYRCGALTDPAGVLQSLPSPVRTLAPWLSPGLARLAKRWIAAGHGCDSSVEIEGPEVMPEQASISSTIKTDGLSERP